MVPIGLRQLFWRSRGLRTARSWLTLTLSLMEVAAAAIIAARLLMPKPVVQGQVLLLGISIAVCNLFMRINRSNMSLNLLTVFVINPCGPLSVVSARCIANTHCAGATYCETGSGCDNECWIKTAAGVAGGTYKRSKRIACKPHPVAPIPANHTPLFSINATVPGDLITDLQRAGLVGDPIYEV